MLVWSLVLVVATLCAMVGAVWLWARPNISRGEAPEAGGVEEYENRVVSEFESPTEMEALALVKRALAVREEILVGEYFRPGEASPGEVVAFLEEMEGKDGGITGYQWLSSMDANDMLIDGVMVSTERDGNPGNRLAFLTPNEDGEWKMDFDGFARTVKPGWDRILERDSSGGLVRVMVADDTYYNGPFGDDSDWACYGLGSPDIQVILYGYCRKGSPQHEAMKKIVSVDDYQAGQRVPKRATLEIVRVEGGGDRQFEISRVLAEDWVMSGRAFDGEPR